MLNQVAEGVLVHESEFCQSNAVVVHGRDGVLLVDPGVRDDEMESIAHDLAATGSRVVAGFSTHPHWDHLAWHPSLGPAPRYGTARCAATAQQKLPDAAARARVAGMLPPEVAGRLTLDLLGLITAVPGDRIPWEGPSVRIIEHQAHASGHAALLIEDAGVLVAGDMLSDVLVPMLDFAGADPIADYLAALDLLAETAGTATTLVPGHGSVGGPGSVRARIDLDRAYVLALRSGEPITDPRIGPAARPGWEWVTDVHENQLKNLQA